MRELKRAEGVAVNLPRVTLRDAGDEALARQERPHVLRKVRPRPLGDANDTITISSLRATGAHLPTLDIDVTLARAQRGPEIDA